MKTVTIVTPTIGGDFLEEAIESVFYQDGDFDCKHLLVIDGEQYTEKVQSIVDDCEKPIKSNLKVMVLPWNVGANGFYGHRVYAAISHLLNTDYVMFLDEDNYYNPLHVNDCLSKIKEDNYDFVFSHRKVVEKNGAFVCRDRFESIGDYPLYLVDTSSYCFNRNFLINAGHLWHWGWGADRRFFQVVKDRAKYACTDEATLVYRLDGNPGSPTRDFFETGNVQFGWQKDGSCKI